MDFDLTAGSWLDIAHDVPQAIDDPICFFRKLVVAVSSDSLEDTQPQLELLAIVWDLCLKALSVAKYLIQEILNHPKDNFQPKSSRTQPDTPGDGDEVSHDTSSVNSQVGDELGTCQSDDNNNIAINQRSKSLVTDQAIPKFEEEIPQITAEGVPQGRVEDDSHVYGRTLPPIANESTLLQLQATYTNDGLKRNVVHRQPSVALDEATTDIQTTDRPSSPNAMEPREPALSEIDEKGSDAPSNTSPHVPELHENTLPDPTPSIPVGKMSRGFQSPISNDQTATAQTALFTPIVNGGVLSPLTEDNWTASPAEKAEISFPEGLPPPSCTERQQRSLSSTASAEAQLDDREQSLSLKIAQLYCPHPHLKRHLY
ncbi:hypothetical protein DL95DRAFT_471525 [Leptodontidium sp. 2 PMI_412]|nr:hypothetical protein DL95DRAFT_471525 [Leptodontidium sp. 2 PMI_412]